MIPEGLGRTAEDQVTNLVGVMDAFFGEVNIRRKKRVPEISEV